MFKVHCNEIGKRSRMYGTTGQRSIRIGLNIGEPYQDFQVPSTTSS
jgi:hypothetical protein